MSDITWEERAARSVKHAAAPQPGDYWHECFAPIAMVVAVNEFSVSYLSKAKATDKHHWTWDTSHVEVKPLGDFKKWLSYGSIAGTWAQVEPEWKHWEEFADSAKAHRATAG